MKKCIRKLLLVYQIIHPDMPQWLAVALGARIIENITDDNSRIGPIMGLL